MSSSGSTGGGDRAHHLVRGRAHLLGAEAGDSEGEDGGEAGERAACGHTLEEYHAALSAARSRCRGETAHEGGQQAGGAVEILQHDHLVGAVHVPVGHRDERRGHAAVRVEDGLRVGMGVARTRPRWRRESPPPPPRRPAARRPARSPRRRARGPGRRPAGSRRGCACRCRDSRSRGSRRSRWRRPARAPRREERAPPPIGGDLLARRGDGGDRRDRCGSTSAESSRSASSTTKAPMRLSMQRLTSRPLGNSSTPAARTPGSPMRSCALGLGPAGGADVDPEILDLGDLLPVVLVHDVDRLLADHADHVPLPRQEPHPLPHEHLVVPAADRCRS